MREALSSIGAVLITTVVYLLGGYDVALQCLVTAIALDYVSGIIRAFNSKTLSSRIGFTGILKKLGILLLVMLSVLIDRVTGGTGAVRTLVIYYFVANEGLSIIENLGQAGLPIPAVIRRALRSLRDQSNEKV